MYRPMQSVTAVVKIETISGIECSVWQDLLPSYCLGFCFIFLCFARAKLQIMTV